MQTFTFKIGFVDVHTNEWRTKWIDYKAKDYDQAVQGVKEYLQTNRTMTEGKII
jgi:hypothetical protein